MEIDRTCELLKSEIFKSAPLIGEIHIQSENFISLNDCREDVTSLMASLAKTLTKITNKKYVIATKYNPLYDEESDKDESFGPWEEDMVLKMYVADALRLKNESMVDSSIITTVRVQV